MYCFARSCRFLSIAVLLLSAGRGASAQELTSALPPLVPTLAASAAQLPGAGLIVSPPPSNPDIKRPAALMPLYVSFASLQLLDAHATERALGRGAVEVNPLMRGVVGTPAGMFAVKAAGTAGVFWASERMWKRNKTAAVVFLIAANSGMAWVVQHNYRAAR